MKLDKERKKTMKKQDIREQIGAEIKRRRKEKRLTQEQLSELTGIGRTAIAKYERGNIELGISHFSIICSALGCDPVEFFRGLES